jgi:hypothetical protein
VPPAVKIGPAFAAVEAHGVVVDSGILQPAVAQVSDPIYFPVAEHIAHIFSGKQIAIIHTRTQNKTTLPPRLLYVHPLDQHALD